MNEYKEATEEFQDGEVIHFTYESYILTLISSVYDYPDPWGFHLKEGRYRPHGPQLVLQPRPAHRPYYAHLCPRPPFWAHPPDKVQSSFLLNAECVCCVCAHACSAIQLCPTLYDPMDCSPPGSSVHGIFLARILDWVAISSSRRCSWPRDGTRVSFVSCIGRWILYHWTTWEAHRKRLLKVM